MNITHAGILAVISLSLAGCASEKYVVVAPDPTTGKYEVKGPVTEWEAFQRVEEQRFQRELRGERPLAGFETWASYWQRRYENIRKYSADADEELLWIKQRRRELGLPLHE